jgi:tRNA(Ile)-lysidine synthase
LRIVQPRVVDALRLQPDNLNQMPTLPKNQRRVKRNRPVRSSRAKLTAFSRRLLDAWQRLRLPLVNAKVLVAVSGGADSTALMLALYELLRAGRLALTITVAHLDHGLRKKASREDAEWVAKLARELGFEFELGRANVARRAKETADNLEQAARRARYEFLAKTAKRKQAQLVLTAHTMDDQAETVLLRLLRGSGADGLTGIEPVRLLDLKSNVALVRPLVTWAKRADTESYCEHRKIQFRIDEMNYDEGFARVRVRQQLVPLLQSFNDKVVEGLARTAGLLREDVSVLNEEADKLLREASDPFRKNKTETKSRLLSVDVLARAPAAIRRRALRKWISEGRGDLRRFEMVHLLGVERLLEGNRGGRIAELPGGATVLRQHGWIEFRTKKS